MADGVVGVGIVGLSARGGWAGRAHVPALAAVDGMELRALAASSVESARAAGEEHGVPLTFGDPAALAAHDDVDLVVISVRVDRHRELVEAVLGAGKAVLCEWPLGVSADEARGLAAAAAGAGVRGAIGLQARAATQVRHVRDLVADGFVGEVLSTTLVAAGGSWGTTIHPGGEYTLDAALGATLLSVPFGHAIDGLQFVLGELTQVTAVLANRIPEVRQLATGETLPKTAADQVIVSGELASGAVAAVHYRGGRGRGVDLRWEIAGTEGEIVLTSPTGHLQMGALTVAVARGRDKTLTPLDAPASYDLAPGATGPASPVAQAYALVRDASPDVPDFAHAVRRHELLAAIETSAAEGRAVRLD